MKKEFKTVDNQGRYVIPKKWIKKRVKDRTIKVEISDEKIAIKPNVPVDIRNLFGSIKLIWVWMRLIGMLTEQLQLEKILKRRVVGN